MFGHRHEPAQDEQGVGWSLYHCITYHFKPPIGISILVTEARKIPNSFATLPFKSSHNPLTNKAPLFHKRCPWNVNPA